MKNYDLTGQRQEHLKPKGYYLSFDFPQIPQALYIASKEYTDYDSKCENTNFLNGVKWSPDGSCLLSASDDNWFRVYDLPQTTRDDAPLCSGFDTNLPLRDDNLQPGIRLHSGETVYDYCWYAQMTVLDPVTCCFFSTSRGHSIHLWDVCGGGALRCSYRGYDAADEVCAARSLASSADGRSLAAGYDRSVLLFDVARPGRDSVRVDLKRTRAKKRRKAGGAASEGATGIAGLISCLAFSSDCGGFGGGGAPLLAAGSYCSHIALVDPRVPAPVAVLSGHSGGATQVSFSSDGSFLFSAARQDPRILCWDARRLDGSLFAMERATKGLNQRVQFDIEPQSGRHLVSGGSGGAAKVFDLRNEGALVDEVKLRAEDVCLNGVSFHPSMDLLATASGERRYSLQKHRRLRLNCPSLKAQEDERSRRNNSLVIFRLKVSLREFQYDADPGLDTDVVPVERIDSGYLADPKSEEVLGGAEHQER